PLPLIIETPSRIELFADFPSRHSAQPRLAAGGCQAPQARIEDLVATLAEAAEHGRQVIMLTEDQRLASAISGAGARSFTLDGVSSVSRLPLQDINRSFDLSWQ